MIMVKVRERIKMMVFDMFLPRSSSSPLYRRTWRLPAQGGAQVALFNDEDEDKVDDYDDLTS